MWQVASAVCVELTMHVWSVELAGAMSCDVSPVTLLGALQGLREVSTSTSILTDPARVPQQVSDMVAMAAAQSQRPSS